jgi:hypothetical protein
MGREGGKPLLLLSQTIHLEEVIPNRFSVLSHHV